MECLTLKHIRNSKEIAWRKAEHHEVMRCTREELEHLDKCLVCAGVEVALYLELWSNAVVGFDVYQGVE